MASFEPTTREQWRAIADTLHAELLAKHKELSESRGKLAALSLFATNLLIGHEDRTPEMAQAIVEQVLDNYA